MTQKQQQELLGKTLWNIADDLRGAMNADDFRDYMLSFISYVIYQVITS
jgi:type I restriction enzyme M protein